MTHCQMSGFKLARMRRSDLLPGNCSNNFCANCDPMMARSAWKWIEPICYSTWIIFILISIYYNIALCTRNNEMFLQKRSLPVFYSLNISFIAGMITFLFFGISTVYGSKILQVISVITAFFGLYSILFFVLIKNWMIYYKYHWQYYSLQSKWQQLINKNILNVRNEQNWFIQNNKTYGNFHWIYKRLVGIVLIACILNSSSVVYTMWNDWSLHTALIATAVECLTISPLSLIYAIIVWKTPYFEDTFLIHWESRLHAKLLILFMIVNPIMITLFLFFGGMHIYKSSEF